MSSYAVFNLIITSNINTFESMRRFPKNITIAELRDKLELLTGASSSSMELHLLDKNKAFLLKLDRNDASLESFSVEDDMYIHVHDPNHKVGEFDDLSSVPKFELSEESYDKRGESFRAFKEKMKQENLAEGDNDKNIEKEKKLKEQEELIKNFHVGDRCEVTLTGHPTKVGTVMYLGTTEFKSGFWVGVKYDQPLGKNDGTVGGKRYFTCEPKYGGFVKPQDVNIIADENAMEEL